MDSFTVKTYTRRMANKYVDAELYCNPENPNDVGILVRADDGSKLTSQEVLDAISDLLLIHYSKDIGPSTVN